MKVYNVKDFGAHGVDFTTHCRTTAGSATVTVESIGPISVGDEVVLRRARIWSPVERMFVRRDTSSLNPRPFKPPYIINGEITVDDYDGSDGDWTVYFIDICPEEPDVLRWSRDFGRTWTALPLNDGKISLDGDLTVTVADFEDRAYGVTAAIVRSTRLVTTVTAVNGNRLTLADTPTLTAEGELLLSDSAGIQRATDAATGVGGTVYLPSGFYRLAYPISIRNVEAVTLLGESAETTVLDNSLQGVGGNVSPQNGCCFNIDGVKELTVKNLRMQGHMGFDRRDQAGRIMSRGADYSYGFYFSKSCAVNMTRVRRALFENCHARRMSAECFYARTYDTRRTDHEPDLYPHSLTYLRCSVEDCGRNAFNNNDMAENTSVLYCRIRDVGGCAWEGTARFARIIGNYVRNAGPIACGNLRTRDAEIERLGTSQHIVSENVFESGINYGTAAIVTSASPTQSIIKNNIFINFNSNAINLVGTTQQNDLTCEHTIVSGNHIDLTAVDSPSRPRYGISAASDYATVTDNHVYVRGCDPDENVTGIVTYEGAANVDLRGNMISACRVGIAVEPSVGYVGEVLDDTRFYRLEPKNYVRGMPPLPRRLSHRFRGYIISWQDGTATELVGCDPDTRIFTLKEPRKLTAGEKFHYYHSRGSRIRISQNMISDCDSPIENNSIFEKSAILSDNLIT